nr:MAG TPA: hypothetical protein [Caudoviricetes sp.]
MIACLLNKPNYLIIRANPTPLNIFLKELFIFLQDLSVVFSNF